MSQATASILFASPTSGIAGAEKVLLSIAEHINRRKFQCFLLAQDEGPLTEQFRKTGGEVFCHPLPAWRKIKNLFRRRRVLEAVVRFMREKAVDFIHCNNYRIAPYMTSAARKLGKPCAVHLHDYLSKKHIEAFQLLKSDWLIGVSRYTLEPFREYAVRSKVIYNGIPVSRFASTGGKAFRKEFGIPETAPTVGIIATFTEKKRHELFLEVAREIHGLNPEIRFVITGDNVWNTTVTREKLARLAAEKEIGDATVFTGWREDIPEILAGLDALIVPSTSEPFPLVVLEAMASGTIVFAHESCGGPAEAIENGVDGFLVDCEDPRRCAGMIVKTLMDRGECGQLRSAALQKVRSRFDIHCFIENIERFYDEAIARGREGATI